jgi:hypothetical protein
VGLWLSHPAIGPVHPLSPFLVRFGYTNVWLGDGPLLHLISMVVFPDSSGTGRSCCIRWRSSGGSGCSSPRST